VDGRPRPSRSSPRWPPTTWPHGGLVDGCYSHKEHQAERHELIWGDYFALEAMLAVDGVVDPGEL
jgi:hypothetical protein